MLPTTFTAPQADEDTASAFALQSPPARTPSRFEPESMTDAQLLAPLGPDYLGADIPEWVMTKVGVLTAKGDITAGEFKTALECVLGNA